MSKQEFGGPIEGIVPLPAGTEMVGGVLADVTLRVALDGFEPGPPPLAEMVGGAFGPISLSGFGGRLEHRDGQINVHLAPLPGSSPGMRLSSLGNRLNQPVRLHLADGGEVVADLGHHISTSTSIDVEKGVGTETAEIELDHWRYGPQPAAWVGRIEGVEFEQGNLFVGHGTAQAPRRRKHKNLRLDGNLMWHIVRGQKGYFAIIDAAASLDAICVHADITALAFTLGGHLELGVLTGVDALGNSVSAASPIFLKSHERSKTRLPPVPPWTDRQAWMPRFFAAISRALAGPDATRFYVAIGTYLDSLSESLDSSYLRLQVALEAFCRYGDPVLPPLVADEGQWRAWVEAHRAEITSYATDTRAAARLMSKVRDSAKQRPTADAVRAAFTSWNLNVSDTEMEELDGRHLVAHRYLMNESEDDRDLERDVDRVTILRTLLVAAVARAAGYGGPIHGWAGCRFGRPAWWHVTEDEAVAQRWYACLRPA